jgi:tRNA (guanine37-N1)-methyltransferase
MLTHSHVRSVFRQQSAVSGDFRLRHLELIGGEDGVETVYKEFGYVLKVNLEWCYFSPRLSFERMRIARLVRPDETVVNMFAGVGSFSVLMAKYSKVRIVYSIDLNPYAVDLMRENVRLNRVESQVVPILGDSKRVILERLQNVADRIVMPLPEKAFEYLEYSVMALKPGKGWIHYYDFEHASKEEDPVEKIESKVVGKLHKLGVDVAGSSGRIVRSTGPNWYQVVLDVRVSKMS